MAESNPGPRRSCPAAWPAGTGARPAFDARRVSLMRQSVAGSVRGARKATPQTLPQPLMHLFVQR
jgi:hypothetical protein